MTSTACSRDFRRYRLLTPSPIWYNCVSFLGPGQLPYLMRSGSIIWKINKPERENLKMQRIQVRPLRESDSYWPRCIAMPLSARASLSRQFRWSATMVFRSETKSNSSCLCDGERRRRPDPRRALQPALSIRINLWMSAIHKMITRAVIVWRAPF